MNYTNKRVADILFERAVEDSANYAESYMKDALIFLDSNNSKERMLQYAMTKIDPKLELFLEFGVHNGESINKLAKIKPNVTIHGFDSFEGLPFDWTGGGMEKGFFNLDGNMPQVTNNVILVKGLFEDTLPKWINYNHGGVAFMNIDCDIYESTKTVLDNLKTRIVSGTVILFDEYFGYPRWRDNEFKAWQEFCKNNNIKYEYLAMGQMQVLVKVI